MIQKRKCIEYYLDSKYYGSREIQDTIENTKKEFPNKKVETQISLNDYGMYIVTLDFSNKETYWSKLKAKRRKQKRLILTENNSLNRQKQYGQYKQTGTFKPY